MSRVVFLSVVHVVIRGEIYGPRQPQFGASARPASRRMGSVERPSAAYSRGQWSGVPRRSAHSWLPRIRHSLTAPAGSQATIRGACRTIDWHDDGLRALTPREHGCLAIKARGLSFGERSETH